MGEVNEREEGHSRIQMLLSISISRARMVVLSLIVKTTLERRQVLHSLLFKVGKLWHRD